MDSGGTYRADDPGVVVAEAKLDRFAAHLATCALDCDAGWECDQSGRVVWSDGETPLTVGEPIGSFSNVALANAFEIRAPFRKLDDGTGRRLSGVPYFSPKGSFLGYRGTATFGPQTGPVSSLFDTGASVDSFARIAHEVRTPLTAIMGFAQMIESETVGAAAPHYRQRASAIIANATRLLEAVDDLADATRLEQGRFAIEDGVTPLEPLLGSLVSRFQAGAARHGIRLSLAVSGSVTAAIEESHLSRALDRLTSGLLATAIDEVLTVGAFAERDLCVIEISRPSALLGLSADALLNPASRIASASGPMPVLGLGFALRLASRLLEAAGARFTIGPQLFRIEIPGIAKRVSIA